MLLFVVIPFWTSFLIRTYAWLIILDPQFPLFRVIHVDLLFSRPAVYLGVAYNYLPLMVLPLYAALERIDWSLVEAAQDLGDTPLRSFRRVTLPLAVPGVIAGSLLVFIPLTGEYLIPAILGGQQDVVRGLADRAAVHRGERLALRVGDRMRRDRGDDGRAARRSRCSRTGTRQPVARRLLGGWAALVFVFLYAPIVVVIVYAFNGGRETLVWDGFSTRWFGAALRDTAVTDALRNSLVIAAGNAVVACILGTMLALALPKMWKPVRVPLEALVTMTLVTPEIVFGIAALIFFTEAGIPLGLESVLIAHVVFNASVVALVVRARFVGMSQDLEEASFDLGAGPLSTFRQVTLPRLAPAVLAGGLLAFTFSFDDFYTSFFVTGAGTSTLPLYIFSSLRFGVTPVVNATAAMILALTLAAVALAYLVLRRAGMSAARITS